MVIFSVTDYPKIGSVYYNNYYYGFNEILEKNDSTIPYGYLNNNDLVNFKFNSPFLWNIENLKTQSCTYNELAYKDASHIVNTNSNVVLFVSGGIDSEFMLQSFLPFSKHVKLIFFDYGYNIEDKKDITERPIYQKFDIEFIKIDAEKFFSNHLNIKYGFTYRTSFPEAMLFLYALDSIKNENTYYVLSGDIPEPKLINYQINFSFVSDNICSIDRWAKINNIKLCSSFLLNTQEKISKVIKIVSNPRYLKFEYKLKKDFYKELGYTIELRKNKYTGLENLRKLQNIWKYSVIIEKFKTSNFDDKIIQFLDLHHHLLR